MPVPRDDIYRTDSRELIRNPPGVRFITSDTAVREKGEESPTPELLTFVASKKGIAEVGMTNWRRCKLSEVGGDEHYIQAASCEAAIAKLNDQYGVPTGLTRFQIRGYEWDLIQEVAPRLVEGCTEREVLDLFEGMEVGDELAVRNSGDWTPSRYRGLFRAEVRRFCDISKELPAGCRTAYSPHTIPVSNDLVLVLYTNSRLVKSPARVKRAWVDRERATKLRVQRAKNDPRGFGITHLVFELMAAHQKCLCDHKPIGPLIHAISTWGDLGRGKTAGMTAARIINVYNLIVSLKLKRQWRKNTRPLFKVLFHRRSELVAVINRRKTVCQAIVRGSYYNPPTNDIQQWQTFLKWFDARCKQLGFKEKS